MRSDLPHPGLRRVLTGLALVAVAVVMCGGCSLFPHVEKCPKGSYPCGTGCMPDNAVCCDNGSIETSSYCTNMASGCYANTDGKCPAAFPMGAVAEFCCGTSGEFGSNDCPEGQHHCGLNCQPMNEPCCPKGATDADCPTRTFDPGGCTGVTGTSVGCAVCLEAQTCVSCPGGSCCAGDMCGTGGKCITGSACFGEGGGGGGCGACTSDSQCSEWGSRHCGGAANPARCGGDGQCHCCYEQCDIGSGGTPTNCVCLGCSACVAQDQMCLGSTCVWRAGGNRCE